MNSKSNPSSFFNWTSNILKSGLTALGWAGIGDSIIVWKDFLNNIVNAYQSLTYPIWEFVLSWIPISLPQMLKDYLTLSLIISGSLLNAIIRTTNSYYPIIVNDKLNIQQVFVNTIITIIFFILFFIIWPVYISLQIFATISLFFRRKEPDFLKKLNYNKKFWRNFLAGIITVLIATLINYTLLS